MKRDTGIANGRHFSITEAITEGNCNYTKMERQHALMTALIRFFMTKSLSTWPTVHIMWSDFFFWTGCCVYMLQHMVDLIASWYFLKVYCNSVEELFESSLQSCICITIAAIVSVSVHVSFLRFPLLGYTVFWVGWLAMFTRLFDPVDYNRGNFGESI